MLLQKIHALNIHLDTRDYYQGLITYIFSPQGELKIEKFKITKQTNISRAKTP